MDGVGNGVCVYGDANVLTCIYCSNNCGIYSYIHYRRSSIYHGIYLSARDFVRDCARVSDCARDCASDCDRDCDRGVIHLAEPQDKK